MRNTGKPLEQLGITAVFLIWGPPHGSHRSQLMGEQLGVDVQHIWFTSKRGKRVAPIKYLLQTFMTLGFLLQHRYQLVFVQDPPILAAFPAYIYSLFFKTHFIIDAHTDALQAPFCRWMLPLHRFLERRAITTIVTNDELRQVVESWGSHAFTLADPPAQFNVTRPMALPDSTLNVVMVSTADYDEPVEEVLQAGRGLPDVTFHITGDFTRSPRHRDMVETAPENVHFIGYLSEDYFALLDAADVIVCLTTEDNTFLSGDSEALWLGKPIITSDWPLLRRYFDRGTIHVDNTAESIRQAVVTMRDNLLQFEGEILALQAVRRREWRKRADDLIHIIQEAVL